MPKSQTMGLEVMLSKSLQRREYFRLDSFLQYVSTELRRNSSEDKVALPLPHVTSVGVQA